MTRSTKRCFKPTLEALENRQLLSAGAAISNSVLVIKGTDKDESISVAPVVGSPSLVEVKISLIDPNTFATIGSPTLDKQFDISKVTKIQMSGFGGVDVLVNNTAIASEQFGGLGNDILAGGSANDILRGEAGDDTYAFSAANLNKLGSDTVIENAGEGTDMLDFTFFGTNVKLDMASNAVAQEVAGNLKLTLNGPIENVQGSAYDDSLRGNALNNYINGGGGDDTLEGRQGDDTLIGNRGNDTYVFANPNGEYLGADTVIEGNWYANDTSVDTFNFAGMQGGLTIDVGLANTLQEVVYKQLKLTLADAGGIENVIGTRLADTIKGNARDNFLSGLDGNDTLYGYAGKDTLDGGSGNDYLYGGDDNDTLFGGDNDDHLFGEAGTDKLYGGLGADFLNGGFDGCQDTLYGNDEANNPDGAVDTLIRNGYSSGFGNQTFEDLVFGDSQDIIQ
jgi:Ca2+-binding RTX toxin-like protein